MGRYGEHDFVRALVPLLISRLPNPLNPTEEDMQRVAKAAGEWSELLVGLRADKKWMNFLFDHDGPAWHQPDDRVD